MGVLSLILLVMPAAGAFDCGDWVKSLCPVSAEFVAEERRLEKRNAYLEEIAFRKEQERLQGMRSLDSVPAVAGKTSFLKAVIENPDALFDAYLRFLVAWEANIDGEATINFEQMRFQKDRAVADIRALGVAWPEELRRKWEKSLTGIELTSRSELFRHARAVLVPEDIKPFLRSFDRPFIAQAVPLDKPFIVFQTNYINSSGDRTSLEIELANIVSHEVGHFVDPNSVPDLYRAGTPPRKVFDCVAKAHPKTAAKLTSGGVGWRGQLMADAVAAQRLARALKRLPTLEQRREALRASLLSWCRPEPDEEGISNADYLQAAYATNAELREAVGCSTEKTCRWQ